jgi:hypothetical protein
MKMKKNRFIKMTVVAAIFMYVFGCSTNEDDLMQPYVTGTVFPEITEVGSSFFNISDIDNAYVNFTVDVDTDIAESITIEKTFRGVTKVVGEYTTVPANIQVTVEEAVSDIDGISVDDLEVGDIFTFEVIVNSKNGLRTRSNVLLNASVACKSSLEGVYSCTANGQSTDDGPTPDENPAIDFKYEITLTATGTNGIYKISDFSGGLYELWYDIYGIVGDSPGQISDVCNTISYSNTKGPFGSNITGGGSVDPDTGVITIDGKNIFGDTWTLVLEPK